MKNNIKTIVLALFAIVVVSSTGCKKQNEKKEDSITVSHDALWFSTDAGTQTITVTTNCAWSIEKNGDEQWYTVSPTSGDKYPEGVSISISVEPFDGPNFRAASFTIKSSGGEANVTVSISQNMVEFTDIIKTIYGVKKVEHWNTDFAGNMIEDTYLNLSFNPHDTTSGFTMYFGDNGRGVQADRMHDSTVYYPFSYEYDSDSRNLHVEFDLVDSTQMEVYDASVLTATEGMFRFQHEYKANFWERAEMVKIGTIDPNAKDVIRRTSAKRKGNGPIFNLD